MAEKMYLQVATAGLHLRAGPGPEHRSLRVLTRGQALERVATDGWTPVTTPDGTRGWIAHRFTVAGAEPAWLRIARGELGQAEIPGARHNPRILEYMATTSYRATTDEVAWCSGFLNWCVLRAGIVGTRLANARSWLTWGREVREPVPGCIVVFRRGSDPAAGHVGFYLGHDAAGGRVRVLGGNQGNRVCEAFYPAADLLGYRMPG
ncbi:MAG: TIGR02594 family protein [Thioalkalivibrio sp.]|nr:TIGR02594 family protein [Thioalkalivibrio sp.]